MTRRYTPPALALWFALLGGPALAHEMTGRADLHPPSVVVEARYGDGTAVAFADTAVHSPAGDGEFQAARTDANGRFAFLPDRPGPWRVSVDDGMGHRVELGVPIDDRFLAGVPPAPLPAPTAPAAGWRLLMGFCLLLGLTGTWLWWRTRRSAAAPPDRP